MKEVETTDLDRCLCGTLVAPHWTSEPRAPHERAVERGSCTGCGLQLVRHPGDAWRHIRG